MCCDSKDEVLVDGHSWSRSCRLAVGMVGVVGTFSLPVTCVIPPADSCTIIHAVRQGHRYKFGNVLPVMAGDCGDEIPSKSKPQSASVTSCANFENIPHVGYLQTSSFCFYCIFCEFRERSRNSSSVLVFFSSLDAVLLVFASPDDLCGNFFFFLNGSSFPSASTLSRNCSSAAPPRYCLPEISLPIELLTV